MFGGKQSVPLVIRSIVGRGWGQGPQHSQNLQALFAHIPGLKVIMPTTPYDAKGLLISSIEDNNPVMFIEHRWLHNTFGEVPEGLYRVPIGKANIIKAGQDITIAAISHMTIESLKASQLLEKIGIDAEIIDIRSLKPFDDETVAKSLKKTGRLLVVESAWRTGSFSSEIISRVAENNFFDLKSAPQKITLPDSPTPSTPGLSKYYYPNYIDIAKKILIMLNKADNKSLEFLEQEKEKNHIPWDVPDSTFGGPF